MTLRVSAGPPADPARLQLGIERANLSIAGALEVKTAPERQQLGVYLLGLGGGRGRGRTAIKGVSCADELYPS